MEPFILQSIHLSEVTSTNDLAKQLAESGSAQSGTWIQADWQSKGRGQSVNRWESGKSQNMLGTFLWMPQQLVAESQVALNMAVSLAVFKCVAAFINGNITIKWPNDIYVGDDKIAGILIENSIQGILVKQCIIGIGINVNQTQFETPQATSLRLQTGNHFTIEEVVRTLHQQLETQLAILLQNGIASISNAYHTHLYKLNNKGWFEQNGYQFEATVSHVDGHGRLVLEVNGEQRFFAQKEITWI